MITSNASNALEVRGLTRTYGDDNHRVRALQGLDLTIAPGTFTAVMGPSGSGKSTFLSTAAGLEPPTSGSVSVGGTDLFSLSERSRARLRLADIGIVFQDFHLLPYLTAQENVALPLRLAGRGTGPQRADQLLERLGLGERRGHRPSELSGGQQQRVAIARALVAEPTVVLADEPTGALDTRSAHDILDLLRDCVDTLGATVVMVTHDPVAAARCDDVVFLVDGRAVGEMADPTVEAVAGQLAHLDDLVGVA